LSGEEKPRDDRFPRRRGGRHHRRGGSSGGPDQGRRDEQRGGGGGGERRIEGDRSGGGSAGGGGRRIEGDRSGGASAGGGGERRTEGARIGGASAGGGGERRYDDRRGGSGGDRGRGGDRRDDRRGGGGDRRGGFRDDRRGGGGKMPSDDMVDLVPQYPESALKRAKGPDGRPMPREVVTPGQVIAEGGDLKPGMGAIRIGAGTIIAATLGIKNVAGGYASVIPLSGQYIPRVGDVVIGRIVDIGPSNWLVDINSPYPSPMHVNEVPWHVEFGETYEFIKPGDAIIVKVARVTEAKRIQVSMQGPGLRKLQGGQLIEIAHSKVPRVIGTNGSMISTIKKYTGCRLVVGQNGLIWIHGAPEDILLAMSSIRIIEEGAHAFGLTNKVKEFLQRAKGIDPVKEAEEEARRAREDQERREREEQERKARQQAQVDERARQDQDRQAQVRREREESARPERPVDKVEEEDDYLDRVVDDELCKVPGSKEQQGQGIVTVLSPDGESLMVLDEDELAECPPGKDTAPAGGNNEQKKKEDI